MPKLDAREIQHYRDEGYVIPSFRLPIERVEQLCQVLEQVIDSNPGTRPEKLVSAHIEGPNDFSIGHRRD